METTFENYWVGKGWNGKNWLPPDFNSKFYDTMKDTVVIVDAEKPNSGVSHPSATGRKRQPGRTPQRAPTQKNPVKKYVPMLGGEIADNKPVVKSVSTLGGGVVVSPYGHILTAYHVIQDSLDFAIRSTKSDKFEDAILIAGDRITDLAIIRRRNNISNRDGHPAPHVKFASPSTIEVGAQTVSINHSLGLCHTLSLGHLAYPSKTSNDESDASTQCNKRTYEWRRSADCYESEEELQTYEPGQKVLQLSNLNGHAGASGCPVFNSAGLLIGMHAFRSKHYDFAIHVDTIKSFVDEVLDEELQKGWLTGCVEGPSFLL